MGHGYGELYEWNEHWKPSPSPSRLRSRYERSIMKTAVGTMTPTIVTGLSQTPPTDSKRKQPQNASHQFAIYLPPIRV